jgi:nitroreductase
MDEMGIFQAMHTARALRRLKPDPVPDDAIAKIIDAGVRAPTGSNLQNWRFFVIKAAEQRRQIAHIYQASIEIAGRAYLNRKPPAHMTKERQNAARGQGSQARRLPREPVELYRDCEGSKASDR